MIKQKIKKVFNLLGYEISKHHPKVLPEGISVKYHIPEEEFYIPVYSPWHNNGKGDFKHLMELISSYSLVSSDRCYILFSLAKQSLCLEGEFYECGVYKGGTALLLASVLAESKPQEQHKLYLFDSFEGMPDTDVVKDWHKKGDFADTSIETVIERVGHYDIVEFNKGFIPLTFSGKEHHKICFAHIDVDIYKSIIDCCEFIYPRLVKGAIMIFDDYGFPTCPGAKQAVDEFFKDKSEVPLILPTGQAIIFKI